MPYELFDDILLYVDPTPEEDAEKREYMKKYRTEPKKEKKEKIKKKKVFKKYDCECGKTGIYITNRNIHNKSKKHNRLIENIKFQEKLTTECLTVSTIEK